MAISLGKKIVFSLLSTIALLTVAEVGARIVFGPIAQDVFVYSYVGDRKDWLMETGSLVRPTYKHQPQSFPIERTTPRLAFLGGSTVHGGSPTVGLDGEFPALVGTSLGMKAWNLARPSIDSHDVLRIVQELKEYSFDAWVIYTGHNDFGNTYFFSRFQNWGARQQVGMQSMLQNMQLYRALNKVNKQYGNGRKKGLGMSDFRGAMVSMEQKEAARELLIQNVRRMIWEARSADVPVLFVVPTASWIRSPLGGCTKGDVCSQDTHRSGVQMMRKGDDSARSVLAQACAQDSIPLRILPQAQDDLRALFIEEGVPFIDAHTELSRHRGIDLPNENLFFDHVHLSKKGHQELAALITNKLRKELGR